MKIVITNSDSGLIKHAYVPSLKSHKDDAGLLLSVVLTGPSAKRHSLLSHWAAVSDAVQLFLLIQVGLQMFPSPQPANHFSGLSESLWWLCSVNLSLPGPL